MKRYASLIPVLVLPAIIVVYLALFWNSVKDMAIQSSGYPKVLIVAIACLLPFVIWKETAEWRQGHMPAISLIAQWWSWSKVVYGTAATIAYVFLIDPLGTYLSSALFVGGLTAALGYRRPVGLASIVVGTLAVIYVFANFLGVNLPGT
jgi:hypothetical protein